MHLAELLRLEDKTLKKLLDVYRTSLADLLDELELTPESTFKAQHLRGLVAQLEAGVREMERRFGEAMRGELREVQQLSLFQGLEEVLDLQRRAPAPQQLISKPVLDAVYAPLIDAPRVLAVREGSLLSTRAWTGGQITTINNTVTSGVLQSKSPKQIAEELRRTLGPKVEEWKVERIARTEFWRAVNAAKHEGAEETARRFPSLELWHVWNAVLDGKTCAFCRAMDGKRVRAGTGETFTYANPKGEEVSVSYPPVHPHCRCSIVTWSDRWGSKKLEGDGEDRSTVESRKEDREARRRERELERARRFET